MTLPSHREGYVPVSKALYCAHYNGRQVAAHAGVDGLLKTSDFYFGGADIVGLRK